MGFCELYFTPLFQSFSISPSLILVITLYHHEVHAAKSILLVVQSQSYAECWSIALPQLLWC